MSNYQQYRGGRSEDTGRVPSPSIWADCPIHEIIAGVKNGVYFEDDFLSGPLVAAGAEASYGRYRGFADTGGSVANGDEWGGAVLLSSDGDNEGASFRMSCCPFQIARGQGKLWFEARLKTSTVTDTKHGIFLGMMEDAALTAISPITAAGIIANVNAVGFIRLEGDGDYFDSAYKANGVTTVTVQADAALIAADTWVKLGFVYDPRSYTITFYRNGVRLDTTYTVAVAAGTDFPNDVRLGLVLAILNATASTPGNTEIDWWRAAQLAP